MNRACPSLVAATMLVVLLLPLVSVASDTGTANEAWQRSPDDRREIEQITGALVPSKRVSGCSALRMITIPPLQVARTLSIRFVAEWRQGYDFARHAVIEIKGDIIASSDDAGPLTPLVYVMPPSGGPERLEIADVNHPRSVLAGESFVIDVTVGYVLNSPREVVVDLYENAGPLLASKRMMVSAEGFAIYDLIVTAPSTARRWQLNIHLQGEYKQSIYIDVGQLCDEGSVRNVVTCPDQVLPMCPYGVTWKQREVCRNNNWVPEYQTCPAIATVANTTVTTSPTSHTSRVTAAPSSTPVVTVSATVTTTKIETPQSPDYGAISLPLSIVAIAVVTILAVVILRRRK